METFKDLYLRILKASINHNLKDELRRLEETGAADNGQLDTILNPMKYPLVMKSGNCLCDPEEQSHCAVECLFSAIKRDESGNVLIDPENCVGCDECVINCKHQTIVDRKETIPVIELLNERKRPVYAMIAPAFNGQFTLDVTAGKLRTAFKMLGFYGMLEVALFADILTLKEALEFDRSINDDRDYMLTSCCCPIWVAQIKRIYHDLVPHMPPAVSPMVACGRAIKRIHPDAVTVFIGPCIAKKAEAKEPDIADAVDFVLTFQEIQEVFEVAGLNPADMPEDMRDHSSKGGRIYARTGGVSEAVQSTLNKLNPDRKIKLKALQADGVPACRELLKSIQAGEIKANFMEGMGCKGGCVGGPKVLIKTAEGTQHTNDYGNTATYETPLDNPHVIDLLHRLGFDTIESLLEEKSFFIRKFDDKK